MRRRVVRVRFLFFLSPRRRRRCSSTHGTSTPHPLPPRRGCLFAFPIKFHVTRCLGHERTPCVQAPHRPRSPPPRQSGTAPRDPRSAAQASVPRARNHDHTNAPRPPHHCAPTPPHSHTTALPHHRTSARPFSRAAARRTRLVPRRRLRKPPRYAMSHPRTVLWIAGGAEATRESGAGQRRVWPPNWPPRAPDVHAPGGPYPRYHLALTVSRMHTGAGATLHKPPYPQPPYPPPSAFAQARDASPRIGRLTRCGA
ncbi:hypothetical protein PLICRDRAFT_181207 [Plicaturopsis crispa FD-325 SS-3]|uniref:Uncharacterized protein n=1 Tax=Plicaturopsis crispa FD-325 SS-3 TaxID=944288 RepID=A0A0C9SPH8_PLICR|nr:hypothetical protein PLICRDRAFT_181207 [Plicaturopsis crispa FD-325 SS-3]